MKISVGEEYTFSEQDRKLYREKEGDPLNGINLKAYNAGAQWKPLLQGIEILLTEFVDPTAWGHKKVKELMQYYDMR